MATAKRVPAKKVVQPPDTIVLELSEPEAASLGAILGRISGSTTLSPRGHTSSIWRELLRLGLVDDQPEKALVNDRGTPGFHFNDYSEQHYQDRLPKNNPW